jgi:hypothetical protein
MTHAQKRAEIKRILALLAEANRTVFKLMYSPKDLDLDINRVVDEMSWRELDWALKKCENSYHKIFTILRGSQDKNLGGQGFIYAQSIRDSLPKMNLETD